MKKPKQPKQPKSKKPKAKTEKQFDLKKFLEKELRRAFKRTPMYQEARRRAKEEFFVESKTGKLLRRVRYICASCNGRFVDKPGAREIAVDHIIPVVDPMVGWVDIGTYAERLYCVVENLQVLCNYAGLRDGKKSCHKIKSAEERKIQAERQRKEK